MPGQRSRHKPNSFERPSEEMYSIPERDLGLDIHTIQKPQSMATSVNSAHQSHVPQIIVRRNNGEQPIQGWTGCNPMLIPMGAQPEELLQFYPQQYHSGPGVRHGEMFLRDASSWQSGQAQNMLHVPKRSFYDYQYRDGPGYEISFDRSSGQPKMVNMDATTMNSKLIEMQNEISLRMLDENAIAKQVFVEQKNQIEHQKKQNLKQILKAYAFKNAQIGPFGTNEKVINMLQQRRMPLHYRKNSRLARPSY